MNGCRFTLSMKDSQHRGLFLEKFLPQKSQGRKTEPCAQAQALDDLCRARFDSVIYRLAFARWKDSWNGQGETVLRCEGRVRDRCAIGLGAEGVLENGVRLQHSYGTPLIPGSALKGILRRGLPREHRDEVREDGRNVEWYLFGNQSREGEARFHDAWWIPDPAPPLVLDVLTPHHQKYIAKKGPPTEFDSPVPVHFFTVRGRFLFVIEAPNASWTQYLRDLLLHTLRRDGVGGKRSSGYGVIDVS